MKRDRILPAVNGRLHSDHHHLDRCDGDARGFAGCGNRGRDILLRGTLASGLRDRHLDHGMLSVGGINKHGLDDIGQHADGHAGHAFAANPVGDGIWPASARDLANRLDQPDALEPQDHLAGRGLGETGKVA